MKPFIIRFCLKVAIPLIPLITALPAAAANDPLASFYKNTLHETRANGTQSWFFFEPDHSYSSRNQDGKTMSGMWTVNDKGEVCITIPGRPAPPPCLQMKATQVGDSWDREGPNGKEHFALEAGRK